MFFTLNEIKNLTEERINVLKENQVAEDKHLEYKLTLPSEKYDEKKEYLADLSSFTNADGGVIFYGIKAKDGIPEDIPGLEIDNPDAEILRLENILRSSIDPRIIGIHFYPLKLSNEKYLIAAHIPKSFNLPHAVNFQGHWKFYSRNSAGKYPLDVTELKSIITLSATIQERIRNFRLERISIIKNRDLPIPISDEPKFIYHLIPLSSFATDTSINLKDFEHGKIRYDLFYDFYKIFNFEGFLAHNHQTGYNADLYIQIFRNGTIEVYNSQLHDQSKKIIYRNGFEQELIKEIPKYIFAINSLGINFPVLLFLSILDIKDYRVGLNSYERERAVQNRAIIRNDLILPEVLINEDSFSNLPLALKPLFDPIWNAAGHSQSPNYNDKGEWSIKQ